MSLGPLGYVGYGFEAVEGTFVAPTVFLPVTSFNFDDTNEYIIPDQIRGSRDRTVAMPGPYSTSGTMEMELVPNGIAALLKAVLFAKGANTSSAYSAGAYTHTFTPGSDSPYFTFEANAADVLIRRYGGVRVNTLEINSAFGEIVTSSWGLEGITRGTTGSPAAESFATAEPFHFTGAQVSIAGGNVANVKSFSFSVGNNLDRVGTLQRTRSYRRTVAGMRDVGLSMALDFDSTTDHTRFLNETEFAVILDLDAGYLISQAHGTKNNLLITIPRVRYNMTSIPISGDFIEQSVECSILRPTNGDPIMTVALKNNEATVGGS